MKIKNKIFLLVLSLLTLLNITSAPFAFSQPALEETVFVENFSILLPEVSGVILIDEPSVYTSIQQPQQLFSPEMQEGWYKNSKKDRFELVEEWLRQYKLSGGVSWWKSDVPTLEEWAGYIFVNEGWTYVYYQKDREYLMHLLLFELYNHGVSGFTPTVNPCLDWVFDSCDWDSLTSTNELYSSYTELAERFVLDGLQNKYPQFRFLVSTKEIEFAESIYGHKIVFEGKVRKVVFSENIEPIYMLSNYSDFKKVFPSIIWELQGESCQN